MDKIQKGGLFSSLGGDLAAGLVVFFVAVPLCLGIALASGAPLFSGIIAGIVGGLVIGTLSKSSLSVSGPAAGLAAIVLDGITEVGAFDIFLCAGIIAGVTQLALGFFRAGGIANFFPTNVIEGMLAGIGLIIILKQLPYAVGYEADYEGSESFSTLLSSGNTFSALQTAMERFAPGAILVAAVGIALMLIWNKVAFLKKIKMLPGPLVAVLAGVGINELLIRTGSSLAISQKHLVNLPVSNGFSGFLGQFSQPNFAGFTDSRVWVLGFTIAIVASIETLLSIEAIDRLDPHKRYTPTDHELKAQGVGNIVSSLIGGLPITSVIVRSSANVNAGGQTKVSAIFHGLMILVCAAAIPFLLNKIPLASLAAILLLTGYKLANPALFSRWLKAGLSQFVPFLVTIVAIVFTNLLEGVALGMIVSLFFLLRENFRSPYFFRRKEYHEGDIIHINLAQHVSFLNKAAIKMTLENLPDNSQVVIDASEAVFIDHDVLELIREFQEVKAVEHDIRLDLIGFKEDYNLNNTLTPQFVYSETPGQSVPENASATASRGSHTELIEKLTTV